MDQKTVGKIIWAHSGWKHRLQEVIDGKKTDVTVAQAGNYRECELGKWLSSNEGQNMKNRDEFTKMHAEFHEKAAEILSLALAGKRNEAKKELEIGQRFSVLTSKVVNALSDM